MENPLNKRFSCYTFKDFKFLTVVPINCIIDDQKLTI